MYGVRCFPPTGVCLLRRERMRLRQSQEIFAATLRALKIINNWFYYTKLALQIFLGRARCVRGRHKVAMNKLWITLIVESPGGVERLRCTTKSFIRNRRRKTPRSMPPADGRLAYALETSLVPVREPILHARPSANPSPLAILLGATVLGATMRTIVIHAPHDLRIDVAADPASPGPGQVHVRLGAGGICGSDLHYFHHGGFGTVRIKEPMILGHEVAGTVTAIGRGVTRVRPGDRVAVNPSLACGQCIYCGAGDANHCLDMRFYGSAMRFPHVQGAFREHLICAESQAVPVAASVGLSAAAFAEPLAVCLHAVRQAGDIQGKRVLITGAGPIGCLTLLAARHAGAGEIVVTDISPAPLAFAERLGASRCVDVATSRGDLAAFGANKGTFDVAFEAAGNAAALTSALETVRPKGTIVQIGLGGAETAVPLSLLVSKEITLRGTFRFHEEFEQAVAAIGSGAIDVAPLLSATLPLADAKEAFALASDRTRAMKVQIAFE